MEWHGWEVISGEGIAGCWKVNGNLGMRFSGGMGNWVWGVLVLVGVGDSNGDGVGGGSVFAIAAAWTGRTAGGGVVQCLVVDVRLFR